VAGSKLIENTSLSGTRCLDVLNGSTVAGGRIVMNPCNGSASQQWNYVSKGFENVNASQSKKVGECLAVYGGFTGDQLRTNTCNSTYYSQNWTLTSYSATTATSSPATPPTSTTGSSSGEHIISTLYAYPTVSSWSQVENAVPTVKYAIVNICAPDGTGSGCGKPADEKNPDWPTTISALKNKGITPLYYISTNYGAVSLSVLESEIQNAISWYGVASPMFDTMATSGTCSNGGSSMACATYYKDLYTYAVNAGAAAVVYNPGDVPPSNYVFGSKEIIQVFEGTAAEFEKTSFPSWMSSYSPGQFAATLSTGTTSTIGTDVSDAVKDHIGNFYEDDEQEPPNYSTLPAFWTTEVNDVTKQ
jgi:hypothetical protein